MRARRVQNGCWIARIAAIVQVVVIAWAPPSASAQSAIERARVLEAEGKGKEAMEALVRGHTECDSSDRQCRLRFAYALGTLELREASRSPGIEARLLHGAEVALREVLRERPTDPAVVSAMATVWQKQGKSRSADSLLGVGIEQGEGPQAGVLAIQLGDLRMSTGQPSMAISAYERALEIDPSAETSARRIVEALPTEKPADLEQILERADQVRVPFPSVAEAALRLVIEADTSLDRTQGEAALLRLVDMLASSGRISPTTEVVPSGSPPGAREHLNSFLRHPRDEGSPEHWWLDSPLRRNVLARVALAMGRRALVSSNLPETAAWWAAGVRVAPHFEDYLFGALRSDAPLVRLELNTELAALYDEHRELDPDGSKVQAIIRELFEGKGLAYHAHDFDVIQRHHTVLGILYARRGVWQSDPSHPWENATFQLERALATAEQRRSTVGAQPLPEIHSLLAEGYEVSGLRSRAREQRLAAARGYLDTDLLDLAIRELGRATSLLEGSDAQARAPLGEVRLLLDVRTAVAGLRGSDAAKLSLALSSLEKGGPRWIFRRPAGSDASLFQARQRFKILADLSRIAYDAGLSDRGSKYAAEALGNDPGRHDTLVGAGDLLRVTRLAEQTRHLVRFDPTSKALELTSTPPKGAAPFWQVAGVLGERQRYAVPSKNLFAAIQINRVLLNDSSFVGILPFAWVTSDSVRVETKGTDPEVRKRLGKKIKPAAEARVVRVQPKSSG